MAALETKARSIVKAVSYRFWATLYTVILVLFVTGETDIALKIGLLDVFGKLFVYFFHERMWSKIKFGRIIPKHPDYEI